MAIVSEVGSNYVEVVQQNIYRKPRQRFEITVADGVHTVADRRCLGWLWTGMFLRTLVNRARARPGRR